MKESSFQLINKSYHRDSKQKLHAFIVLALKSPFKTPEGYSIEIAHRMPRILQEGMNIVLDDEVSH